MKVIVIALGAALLGGSAAAQIKDTSFRDADGHRVQQLECIVNAPVKNVWAAFTTDKGFESWAAPVAHVTLGNDGMIEASYLPASKIGDADNIRNRIVAYVPEHLLVFHNEHAPKNGPFKQAVIDKIRTVVEFQDLGNGTTRVIESGVGYGESPDFDTMYEHFASGNAEEFGLLLKLFEHGPVDWSKDLHRARDSAGDNK
ncbi:MAG: SRPBCC domain-containing protein [Alphaproteobacteria bacterium]|nr:SRPBCC domain-containing protein [Alphaproteobacteria bacterium]MBV9694686.1 SRPBCC domain-containing protein [Alphaproteobacteria bacterium]